MESAAGSQPESPARRRSDASPRLRVVHDLEPSESGLYVAYWMTCARRSFWNHAMQRAAAWSRQLGRSLLVCEPVRLTPASTIETHRRLVDGMRATEQRLSLAGVLYHPMVETEAGSTDGLIQAVASRAAVLIADAGTDAQGFRDEEAAESLGRDLRVEIVDGHGVLLRSEPRTRLHFRQRFRQSLSDFPARNPLAKFEERHLQAVLPNVTTRWPRASGLLMAGDEETLVGLGLDRNPVPDSEPGPGAKPAAAGGSKAAFENWRDLLLQLAPSGSQYGQSPTTEADPEEVNRRLEELRTHIAFGHLSRHHIIAEALRHCSWTPDKLGQDEDEPAAWWGLPASLATVLDEFCLAPVDEVTKS